MAPFAVRFPSPTAASPNAFLEAYDRGIEQGNLQRQADALADIRAMQMAEARRSFATRAATEQAVQALLGGHVPEETIPLAAARTMPSERVYALPGAVEPERLDEPAVPYAGPPDTLPAETMAGRTMAGVSRTLGPQAAMRLITTPEGQAAMKWSGVMSEEDVRSRRALAEAKQESAVLHRETQKALRDGDALTATLKQSAYYQRLERIFAQTNPKASHDAGVLSQQLRMEAIKLQKDEQERTWADEAAADLGARLARLMKDPTAETAAEIALWRGQGKWAEQTYRNFLVTSYGKMIERIDDAPARRFLHAHQAAVMQQMATNPGGPINQAQAYTDAVRALGPEGLTFVAKAIAAKGLAGDYARHVYFGRQTSLTEAQHAAAAVEAMRNPDGSPMYPKTLVAPDGSVRVNPAYHQAVLATLRKGKETGAAERAAERMILSRAQTALRDFTQAEVALRLAEREYDKAAPATYLRRDYEAYMAKKPTATADARKRVTDAQKLYEHHRKLALEAHYSEDEIKGGAARVPAPTSATPVPSAAPAAAPSAASPTTPKLAPVVPAPAPTAGGVRVIQEINRILSSDPQRFGGKAFSGLDEATQRALFEEAKRNLRLGP